MTSSITSSSSAPGGPWLGIEGGGTHTLALLVSGAGDLLQRFEAGPANLRLVSDRQLVALLRRIRQALGHPAAIGLAMAGARTDADLNRLRQALARVWPGVPAGVGHDLEAAWAAADPPGSSAANARSRSAKPSTRVVVLSGTGSCTYGRNARGEVAKVGGWGHWLGDRGSGHQIAHAGLRRVVETLDRTGRWDAFGARVLRALMLNSPEELVGWIQSAPKEAVAALAPEVFGAAEAGSRLARGVLEQAAEEMARDAAACAARLGQGQPVEFVFAGSVFVRQPSQVRRVTQFLRKLRSSPGDRFVVLSRETAWGTVAMAQRADMGVVREVQPRARETPAVNPLIPVATQSSPTEARHPRSMKLDRMPLPAAVDLFLDEDGRLPEAVRVYRAQIVRLVQYVARALRSGGRLFYVGAGTSGRLGVLDASECPPTFRSDPEQVQGVIAGGQRAIWSAVEGAEDDVRAGAEAVKFRQVGPSDVVVGLAASGRTPFVWGALAEARKRGARLGFVACNPHMRFPRGLRPEVVITPDLGPELLTGSTRLKSGTATKLILNLVTTLAMVRLGKVVSNLMVDLNPSNTKLRDRACRIVEALTGADRARAQAALEQSGWVVKQALRRLER